MKPPVGTIHSPETAAAGKKTVRMIFPKPVRLCIGYAEYIEFPAGTHEVPEDLADHWYLKIHGAKPVGDCDKIVSDTIVQDSDRDFEAAYDEIFGSCKNAFNADLKTLIKRNREDE